MAFGIYSNASNFHGYIDSPILPHAGFSSGVWTGIDRHILGDELFHPALAEVLPSNWLSERKLARDLLAQLFAEEMRNFEPTDPAIHRSFSFPRWGFFYTPDEYGMALSQLLKSVGSKANYSQSETDAALKSLSRLATFRPGFQQQLRLRMNEIFSANRDGNHALLGIPRTLYNSLFMNHLLSESAALLKGEIRSFPEGSMALKLAWERLPKRTGLIHWTSTDVSALLSLWAQPNPEWSLTNESSGDSNSFYVQISDQEMYVLKGMHLAVKLSDRWIWTSAWWGSNGFDFSQDAERSPENLQKFCHSFSHELSPWIRSQSGDRDTSELNGIHRLLLNQFRGQGWCSNPFLEKGPGNAQTSCIGCHQYAGTTRTSEEILKLPDQGRAFEQNSTDHFLWSLRSSSDNFFLRTKAIRDSSD